MHVFTHTHTHTEREKKRERERETTLNYQSFTIREKETKLVLQISIPQQSLQWADTVFLEPQSAMCDSSCSGPSDEGGACLPSNPGIQLISCISYFTGHVVPSSLKQHDASLVVRRGGSSGRLGAFC
jgi:hypothetical protein